MERENENKIREFKNRGDMAKTLECVCSELLLLP